MVVLQIFLFRSKNSFHFYRLEIKNRVWGCMGGEAHYYTLCRFFEVPARLSFITSRPNSSFILARAGFVSTLIFGNIVGWFAVF
jgi:hypothetical protein